MRRPLTAALAVGLISGVVGAFAFSLVFDPAEAAESVLRVIQVHEVGTANVNVTNASVPVSGTVDVGNLPDGRVTLVAENLNLGVGQPYVSDWVDTSDCSTLAVFVDPPASPSLQLSPDGVVVSAAIGPAASLGGGAIHYFELTFTATFPDTHWGEPVVAPMAAVAFGGPGVVNKAYLFCSP